MDGSCKGDVKGGVGMRGHPTIVLGLVEFEKGILEGLSSVKSVLLVVLRSWVGYTPSSSYVFFLDNKVQSLRRFESG